MLGIRRRCPSVYRRESEDWWRRRIFDAFGEDRDDVAQHRDGPVIIAVFEKDGVNASSLLTLLPRFQSTLRTWLL